MNDQPPQQNQQNPQPLTEANLAPLPAQEPRPKHRFSPSRLWPHAIRNKLGRAASPLALLVIFIILGGISFAAIAVINNKQSKNQIEAEVLPVKTFQVVSTSPSNGVKGVGDDTKITVNFNQPVNVQKLEKSFILTPTIQGSLVQGTNAEQVVFTPNVPFNDTTVVTLMIDNNFQSTLGQKLSKDFTTSFTTNIPDNTVEFSKDDAYYNLLSAQSNTDQKLTLTVGKQVDPNGKLFIYKATLNPLLASLEYQKITSDDGYSYDQPSTKPVDTTGFQQLTSSSGLKDQATFDIKETSGIYLVAAVSNGVQVGWTWVVFNDYGTIMRQDDQKVILSTYNLTDNSTATDANVNFYNLENGVNQLQQSSLQSPQSFNFSYSQPVDVAVVTAGGDTMVMPIALSNSLGDNRVRQDLSAAQQFYAITDKPTYAPADTVKFAGYASLDNDAQYTADQASPLKLYVASQDDPTTPLQNLSVPLSASGQFSGQFALSGALANPASLAIYPVSSTGGYQYASPIATFTVASPVSANSLKVSFDKAEYTANNTVKVTITGTNSSGQALAGGTVQYSIFTKPYYENDPTANLQSFGSNGSQVGNPATATLDSNGQATVNVDLSQLGLSTTSQDVTVQAQNTGGTGTQADAGDSAIVHQGNIILSFGTGKTFFDSGEARVGRVYATDLNGKPLPNTDINYQFVTYTYNSSTQQEDPTVLTSGSGTTDSNGYLEISSKVNTEDTVTILANAKDSGGNNVQAQYVTSSNGDSGPVMAGADNLDYLDVSGSNGTAKVGDKIPLTITAPQNMTVLASYERGRVYKYQTLNLKQGDNSFSVDVTAQLAPSFNLVFSYFLNGQYHTEGTKFVVSNPASQLEISVTPDQNSYKAGQTANVALKTTANGQAVPTHAIVVVQSDSEFNLNNSFQPDMLAYYYASREYSTNSSSSLTGVGSGFGGKCGGGGFDLSSLTNNTGSTLYWNPTVTTDGTGAATVSFPMQAGKWHISVYAMGSNTSVGDTQATITATQ